MYFKTKDSGAFSKLNYLGSTYLNVMFDISIIWLHLAYEYNGHNGHINLATYNTYECNQYENNYIPQ